MEDRRSELIRDVFKFLVHDGFKVSDPNLNGLVSFDLIAVRERLKLVIKILHNIDTLRYSSAIEMMKLSRSTAAAPIIIGEKGGSGKLERGIVYYRHNVPIFSPESFYDYINGEKPYVCSGPGGIYVSINGEKLKEQMEKLRFSIGYVASRVGTSRRSVSLYENGSGVSIDIFMKLQHLFDSDLKKGVDLMDLAATNKIPENEEHNDIFFSEFTSVMTNYGYEIRTLQKSPFDAIAFGREVLSFLIDVMAKESTPANRIAALNNLSSVLDNEAFLVSKKDEDKRNVAGCPVITLSELRRLSEPDLLLDLIQKRKSL